MPNITYINGLLAIVFAGLLGTMASAQEAPPNGCFVREYSAVHLAKHPDQVVKRISLNFTPSSQFTIGSLGVKTANQGHVRQSGNGGKTFHQSLECTPNGEAKSGWACFVECDAGSLYINRLDREILEFRTKYMTVGEGDSCGGVIDITEIPDVWVTYRMYRVDGDECVK